MSVASLRMYISPPMVAAATRSLWQELGRRLRDAGISAPESLDEETPHDKAWLRPDLLLAQTCGYPYVQRLRGKVQLVATPVYSLNRCDGPLMCSFIIVSVSSSAQSLEDVRGSRVAVNDTSSNSGYNLLRASVAPLAIDGRFFSSVMETGGHQASIEAVSSGMADVAAIDCVTFGNTLRLDPERVRQVRVLAETVKGPGLPFITSISTSEADLNTLRRVLVETIADPALQGVCNTLSLFGVEFLGDDDYEALVDLERKAQGLDYPKVA